MPEQSRLLLNVLDRAQTHGSEIAAIFDLDSTLFNVSPRITQILFEFSQAPEQRAKHPRECALLERTEHLHSDWGLQATLQKSGLTELAPGFYEELRGFWEERFFSNHYLQYDHLYPGAHEYVTELHQRGAQVFYLTGRDQERMGIGTLAALQKWNFPLPGHANQVALKPHKTLADAPFKRGFVQQLEPQHREIWFFDNDPTNLHEIAEHCPQVHLVFFDSVHSGERPPPQKVHTVKDFIYRR